MSKAVGQIDAKVNSITGIQSQLSGQITGHIGSGWQGNAANAFLRSFEDFNGQFTKVLDALGDIHTKLQTSLGQYSSTEEDQTQTATSSINAALNG
jgi:WXG100 family type VII secretion target